MKLNYVSVLSFVVMILFIYGGIIFTSPDLIRQGNLDQESQQIFLEIDSELKTNSNINVENLSLVEVKLDEEDIKKQTDGDINEQYLDSKKEKENLEISYSSVLVSFPDLILLSLGFLEYEDIKWYYRVIVWFMGIIIFVIGLLYIKGFLK